MTSPSLLPGVVGLSDPGVRVFMLTFLKTLN